MIGKRLKELRMKRGFSQQELGTAIGVTKVSICGYENGTRLPTLDNLVKISEVLETTTDYLLNIHRGYLLWRCSVYSGIKTLP